MLSYCIYVYAYGDVATAASDYLHFESHRNAKRLRVRGAGAEVNVCCPATEGGWGYYDDDYDHGFTPDATAPRTNIDDKRVRDSHAHATSIHIIAVILNAT